MTPMTPESVFAQLVEQYPLKHRGVLLDVFEEWTRERALASPEPRWLDFLAWIGAERERQRQSVNSFMAAINGALRAASSQEG